MQFRHVCHDKNEMEIDIKIIASILFKLSENKHPNCDDFTSVLEMLSRAIHCKIETGQRGGIGIYPCTIQSKSSLSVEASETEIAAVPYLINLSVR